MSNGLLNLSKQPSLKTTLLASSLLSVGWSLPASAQLNVPPPTQIALEENGVNTASGQAQLPTQTLTIGPSDDPLVYEDYNGRGSNFHNYHLDMFSSSAPTGYNIQASVLNDSYAISKSFFRDYSAPSTAVSSDGHGASLTLSGSVYSVTTSDGTKFVYGNTDLQTSDATGGPGWSGRVSEIVKPSGLKTNLYYKKVTYTCPNSYCPSTGGTKETKVRIQSVVRSDGYQFHFNYASNLTGTGAQQQDWSTLASVVAFNQAADYCAPTADTCSFVKQWPTLSYQRNVTNGNVSVTTPQGTAVYSSGYGGTTTPTVFAKFQSPGASSPNEVVNYGSDYRVANITRDGLTWNYAWTLTQIGFFPIVYQTTMVRTNPDGTTRTVVTDPGSIFPTSVTDEAGKIWTYNYDGAQRLTKATAPSGRYTSYTYDIRGNTSSVTNVASPGSGLSDVVTTASFPATCTNPVTCNKPTWTKDALGNQTDYAYDLTHGGLLTVTLPADASSVRPQIRYSYGQYQAYLKNATGSIVATGLPVYLNTGVSTCSSATSANPANCVGTAAEGKKTLSFGPQSAGTANNLLLTGQTESAGDGSLSATSTSAYDLLGNKTSVDGPLPGTADTIVYRYDPASRLTGIISSDPDGTGSRLPAAQRISYNARGQVSQVEAGTVIDQSDAAWVNFNSLRQTITTYDTNARPMKFQVTAGGTTYAVSQQNYDAGGRIKCSVVRMDPAQWSGQVDACIPQTNGSNGSDRVTQTTYDALGRVASTSEGVGTANVAVVRSGTYTSDGTLATATDAEGNRTTYEYDGFDRLAKVVYPSTTKGAGTSNASDYEQLGYDGNSNVTSRRLRDGQTIGLTYDNLGRLTFYDQPVTGAYWDLAYEYDLVGRLKKATGNGWAVNAFTYDALGRLTVEQNYNATTSHAYDIAGRQTRLTWSDGFYVDYDHDVTGNVTAIRENGATSGIGVLATYAYDNLGRRTSVTRGNGTVTGYGYDPASRLSSLTQDLGGTAQDLTLGFGYNAAGQIISNTRSADIYAWGGHYNVDRSYVANGLNQLTSAGTTALAYDGRGNLTSSGSSTYSYTVENRLVKGPGVTLAYEPTGERLLQIYNESTGADTRFAWSGSQMIAEFSNSPWQLLRRYVPGPGIDEPIVWYEGSGTSDRRFLHSDERGSIVAVTDASGSTIAINSYDEYGIPGSSNIGRFGYTGQAWLPELGMWYYKARAYSPTLGRFMQTDPIGYNDGMNWYNYVGSDPINGTDPSGLEEGGGQQTIFQSIIVNGIRSISISALSGMDISVNTSLATPVFGGITIGDLGGFLRNQSKSPAPAAKTKKTDEEEVTSEDVAAAKLQVQRACGGSGQGSAACQAAKDEYLRLFKIYQQSTPFPRGTAPEDKRSDYQIVRDLVKPYIDAGACVTGLLTSEIGVGLAFAGYGCASWIF